MRVQVSSYTPNPVNSTVECLPYKQGVVGSNPTPGIGILYKKIPDYVQVAEWSNADACKASFIVGSNPTLNSHSLVV